MKIFILVLIAATILGGFAGGEVMDITFSILGACIGGVGAGAVLLGLGAYFSAQEEKKASALTPEMRGVFDRTITGKQNPIASEVAAAKLQYKQGRKTKPGLIGSMGPDSSD